MKSKNHIYLHGLDHLRAFAAFVVLFFHAVHNYIDTAYVPENMFMSYLEEGYSGVALFICITGFIFTYIIGDQNVDYKKFLYNRFIRIFPLLFIATLLLSYIRHGVHGVDHLMMLKFFNLFGGGVIDTTWTLMVEVQFYLFFPIVYVYCRDQYRGRLTKYIPFLMLILIGFVFRSLYYVMHGSVQDLAYGTIFGRIDQFMTGIIAAMMLKDCNQYLSQCSYFRKTITGFSLVLLAMVLVIVFYHYFNLRGGFFHLERHPSPSKLWLILPTMEGVLYSLVIIGWVILSNSWHNWFSKLVAYLGKVSYSTYLLHLPVVNTAHVLLINTNPIFSTDPFVEGTIVVLLIIYPLTIVLSAISYEVIEKPFLSKKIKYLS